MEAEYQTLTALFDGHLSRHARNIRQAMDAYNISDGTVKELIECGAVKVLDFGHGQIHLERQVFSEENFQKLIYNTQKETTW